VEREAILGDDGEKKKFKKQDSKVDLNQSKGDGSIKA